MTKAIAPIMIDVLGTVLTKADIKRLQSAAVGGVILFSRNYESKAQLKTLIQSMRQIKADLLIAVDQEGGRVQRFRHQFTPIPAMARLGDIYDNNADKAIGLANSCGQVLAYELAQLDIDFSFTPVLDVSYGNSSVIGDRSFHHDHGVIIELAQAFVAGMHQIGMPVVGKHFPGHGFVASDSHVANPIDTRAKNELLKDYQLFGQVKLDAIMPAHVVFPQLDKKPACYSSFWLKSVLRQQLHFQGCVFSDDLTMQGADFFACINERVKQALRSGCDMVLICNRPDWVDEVINHSYDPTPRLNKMHLQKTQLQKIKKSDIKAKIIDINNHFTQ